jgi:hypothetical protein
MTREEEYALEAEERWRQENRLRSYRCEDLFWRLWGIPMELAESISSQVWMVDVPPFGYWWHRNSHSIIPIDSTSVMGVTLKP